MTSIDEIFKNASVGGKRRLDPARDPTEIYKAAKLAPNGHGSRHSRVTAAVDHDDGSTQDTEAGPVPPLDGDGDEDGDDDAYGPSAPPAADDDEPDAADEDGEGRFFGGGISAREREVLDFVESTDAPGGPDSVAASAGPIPIPPSEAMDAPWARRTAAALDRLVARNAELRARFPDNPARFLDSEADLDAGVRALAALSQKPALYPDLCAAGLARALAALLAHENADIAVAALEVLAELTDEDVAATPTDFAALCDTLLADDEAVTKGAADLVPLLVGFVRQGGEGARLDEDGGDEADRAAVYHALRVVENLASTGPERAEALGAHRELLAWLLVRAAKQERPISQNTQYAAEVLAVLVQAGSRRNRLRLIGEDDGKSRSRSAREKSKEERLDAVDTMLQLVAPYRRQDPEQGSDEEEYMENLFEALTCMTDEPEGKARFVEAEGVELCLIMLKEGKPLARAAALRLLDHAAAAAAASSTNPPSSTSSPPPPSATALSTQVCLRLVDAGGLKTLFTLFMRTTDPAAVAGGKDKNKKKGKKRKQQQPQDARAATEHLVGVFASLLRLLPGDAPERVRALAKFVERDYEKAARLLALRREYAARVAGAEARFREEQKEEREERRRRRRKRRNGGGETDDDDDDYEGEEVEEDELFSRRLDAGLFCLQTVDVILAWLVAEDDGARRRIRELLAERGEGLAVIRETIREQMEGLEGEAGDGAEDGEGGRREVREMLGTLAEFLD